MASESWVSGRGWTRQMSVVAPLSLSGAISRDLTTPPVFVLFVCLFVCLFGLFVCLSVCLVCLFVWLVGWLVDWLVGFFVCVCLFICLCVAWRGVGGWGHVVGWAGGSDDGPIVVTNTFDGRWMIRLW